MLSEITGEFSVYVPDSDSMNPKPDTRSGPHRTEVKTGANRTRCTALWMLLSFSLPACQAAADTWPGWRGASGQGVTAEVDLPTQWTATENIRWQAGLRGKGNSSPAITRSSLVVTSQDETDGSLWVTCLDPQDGQLRWETQVGRGRFVASGPTSLYVHRHNPATASPAANEQSIVAFFGTGDLVCFEHSGKEIWRRNLSDDYGAYDIKFGIASSPRIWGSRVFLTCIHKGPSYVVAFELDSGREAWLTPRSYPGMGDAPDAYTSPVILPRDGAAALLIVSGCDHVDAYDTETGERVWYSGGLMIPDDEYSRIIASPAVGDGMVVAAAGKGEQAIALRADGIGNVTESGRLWSTSKLSDCPSPVVHNDICYSVRDEGVATAFSMKTGEVVWRLRLGGNRYQASPIIGDGKVYFLSLDGKCTVVREGEDGEILSRNTVEGEFYATPAISHGMIFLRDRSALYAVGRPGGN